MIITAKSFWELSNNDHDVIIEMYHFVASYLHVMNYFNEISISLTPVIFSVPKSHTTLCNPMNCNTPSFPVLQYLPEFAQMYVHWVGYAI